MLTRVLLLASLIGVAGAGWLALGESSRVLSELALISRAQVRYRELDTLGVALREAVSRAVLLEGSTSRDLADALSSIRSTSQRMRAALNSPSWAQLPEDIDREVSALEPVAKEFLDSAIALASTPPGDDAAIIALSDKNRQLFGDLQRASDAVASAFSRHASTNEERAMKVTGIARSWIVGSTGAIATCVYLLVAWVGRSMQRSLREVRDVAGVLASGNLGVRLAHEGADELGELARAINKMADHLDDLIGRLRADADRDAFGTQLSDALEMAGTEADVYSVAARAMRQVLPNQPMELLLSDSSRTHLERVAIHPDAGGPGCTVESPYQCVAVRRGIPVAFENSEALNACPHLAGRGGGCVSASCVPLSFMGRSFGVLHATDATRQGPTPDQLSKLKAMGLQVGSRIGTIRAFERTQLQARTDSLTGLSNRRSLEEAIRTLAAGGRPFAFVLADLDHFKQLNDLYGHAAGDQALRLFSAVLARAVGPDDLVARWGGEEFALVLPECSTEAALGVTERIRVQLRQAIAESGTAPFTSSFGIADSSMANDTGGIVRIADQALYASKGAGRDRATVGSPSRAGAAPLLWGDQQAAQEPHQDTGALRLLRR